MSEHLEVLLADDDSAGAREIEQGLTTLGCTVSVATSSELAFAQAERRRPDLVIIQLEMVGAVENCRKLQEKHSCSIILAVDPVKGVDVELMTELKPIGVISKPLRRWELAAVVNAGSALARERSTGRERDLLLSRIVDGALDGILVLDRQGKVTFANATSSRMLKRSTAEIQSMGFSAIFPADGDGNSEIKGSIDSIYSEFDGAIGSGCRATVSDGDGGRQLVVVIANPVRGEDGKVLAVSLSFRPAPAMRSAAVAPLTVGDSNTPTATNLDLGGRADTRALPEKDERKAAPQLEQAKRAIALRIDSGKCSYGVVLVLSQFDVFRMRYGIGSAEKLLHALSARVMNALPQEDRLFQWSTRALIVLCERDSSLEEVRLEMTALCSRRLDYFLNGTERSALLTLSANWMLLPLSKDTNLDQVIEQIDGFERKHIRQIA